MRYFVVQTSTVFNFLSQNNLLVPFLHENKVLEELTKEDLLVVVEKLLNPTIPTTNKTHKVVEEAIQHNVFTPVLTVDTNYRKNTIKYTVQDVLNKLHSDGIILYGSFSKSDVNKTAEKLDLIKNELYKPQGRYNHIKRWLPTDKGKQVGVKQNSFVAVWYSIEAYEMIKDYLLGQKIK